MTYLSVLDCLKGRILLWNGTPKANITTESLTFSNPYFWPLYQEIHDVAEVLYVVYLWYYVNKKKKSELQNSEIRKKE